MTHAAGSPAFAQPVDPALTPRHGDVLRALFDSEQRAEAIDRLYATFLPLGVPTGATVGVGDELIAALATEGAPRAVIITFIHNAARWVVVTTREGVAGDLDPQPVLVGDGSAQEDTPAAIVEVCDAAPRWGQAIAPLMTDPDPQVALAACRATMRCAPQLRPDVATALRHLAAPGGIEWQRGAAVFLLGHLGQDVRTYLDDDARYVRLVAALAPGLTQDGQADRVVAAALGEPVDVDLLGKVFGGLPGVLSGTIWRLLAARVAAARTLDEARLVDAALAIASHARASSTTSMLLRLLGPVLRGAAPGRALSAEQRRYLAAVAADDQVWDAGNRANIAAFARVGLPPDRSGVRALVEGAPMPAATSGPDHAPSSGMSSQAPR